MKSKHPNVIIEKRTRNARKNVGSSQYKCHHCGGDFSKRPNLDRHVRSIHTTAPAFNCTRCGKGCMRSLNLGMHMRTCTGAAVAAVPSTSSSTPAYRGGSAFAVGRRRRALGGAAKIYTVDM